MILLITAFEKPMTKVDWPVSIRLWIETYEESIGCKLGPFLIMKIRLYFLFWKTNFYFIFIKFAYNQKTYKSSFVPLNASRVLKSTKNINKKKKIAKNKIIEIGKWFKNILIKMLFNQTYELQTSQISPTKPN